MLRIETRIPKFGARIVQAIWDDFGGYRNVWERTIGKGQACPDYPLYTQGYAQDPGRQGSG
jgi:hypothetical protein